MIDVVYAVVCSRVSSVRGNFVYLIAAEDPKCCYVGITRGSTGALGRLSQHLSDTDYNTFIQKLIRYFEFEDPSPQMIHHWAVNVESHRPIRSKDHLLSLEYLVACKLVDFIYLKGLGLTLISRAEPSGYEELKYLNDIADEFVLKVSEKLLQIFKRPGL
jgi:hypothetical protein